MEKILILSVLFLGMALSGCAKCMVDQTLRNKIWADCVSNSPKTMDVREHAYTIDRCDTVAMSQATVCENN